MMHFCDCGQLKGLKEDQSFCSKVQSGGQEKRAKGDAGRMGGRLWGGGGGGRGVHWIYLVGYRAFYLLGESLQTLRWLD